MSVSRPCYASRQAVMARPDIKFTAGAAPYVDDAIERSSDSIDGGEHIGGQLKRRFYPETESREIEQTRDNIPSSDTLWLPHGWEIPSLALITSVAAGGTTIPVADLKGWPPEPPHCRLDIKPSSSASWLGGSNEDLGVVIATVWNYPAPTTPAGTLAESLDASETSVDISNSAAVGVGDVILVDSERMLVTDVGAGLNTGQTLGGSGLALNNSAVAMTVSDGTAFNLREILTVGGTERVRIDDINGNVLTVKRAYDGSVLAQHAAGATIYAPRTLVVQRGALGTTAATHTTSTAIYRVVYPAAVRSLAVGEAVHTLLSEPHGYARMIGEGESARESSGRGLRDLRKDAWRSHGRKGRHAAI